jgi:hypothetical protein
MTISLAACCPNDKGDLRREAIHLDSLKEDCAKLGKRLKASSSSIILTRDDGYYCRMEWGSNPIKSMDADFVYVNEVELQAMERFVAIEIKHK